LIVLDVFIRTRTVLYVGRRKKKRCRRSTSTNGNEKDKTAGVELDCSTPAALFYSKSFREKYNPNQSLVTIIWFGLY
jgi:hypothetical protein